MQRHITNRHLTFLLIVLMHIALIFIWLRTSPSTNNITRHEKAFFLIPLAQKKPAKDHTQHRPPTKTKSISNNTLASKKPVHPLDASKTILQTPIQVQIPESTTSISPVPLQKDIRALSQSLKEDFLKQEKNFRPDSKSRSETMQKFSHALADAAQIPREGVVIEKKFAYDGRPVSKVKTPYGTYCVRHPKAGEKPELSPPPLPVTCGQL